MAVGQTFPRTSLGYDGAQTKHIINLAYLRESLK